MKEVLVPQFTVADIQIGVGEHEFNKAFALYKNGDVNEIKKDFFGFRAVVSGTYEYEVNVDLSSYDRGSCNCYLGQKDQLCKHMLALAIALVYKFRPNVDLRSNVCSN